MNASSSHLSYGRTWVESDPSDQSSSEVENYLNFQNLTMNNPHGNPLMPFGVPNSAGRAGYCRKGLVLYLTGLPKAYTSDDLWEEFLSYGPTYANALNGAGEVHFNFLRSAAAAEDYAATCFQYEMLQAQQNSFLRENYVQEGMSVALSNCMISVRDNGVRQLHVAPPIEQRMLLGSDIPVLPSEDSMVQKGLANRFRQLPTEHGMCFHCGKRTAFTCMKCDKFVCSVECQKESWPTHKMECKIPVPPVNFAGPKYRKDYWEFTEKKSEMCGDVTTSENVSPELFQPRSDKNVTPTKMSSQSEPTGDHTASPYPASSGKENARQNNKPGILGMSPQDSTGRSPISMNQSYEKSMHDNDRFQSGSRDGGPKQFSGERNGHFERSPRSEGGRFDRPPRQDGFKNSNYFERPTRSEGSTSDRPAREKSSTCDRPPRQEGSTFDRPPPQDKGSFDGPPPQDKGSFDRSPPQDGGSFDRPPRQDGGSFDRPPRQDGGSFDRPPRQDGGSFDRPPRQGMYDRPPPQDGGSFDRPPRQEKGSFDRPPRPNFDRSRQENRLHSGPRDGSKQSYQDKPRYDNNNRYQSVSRGDGFGNKEDWSIEVGKQDGPPQTRDKGFSETEQNTEKRPVGQEKRNDHSSQNSMPQNSIDQNGPQPNKTFSSGSVKSPAENVKPSVEQSKSESTVVKNYSSSNSKTNETLNEASSSDAKESVSTSSKNVKTSKDAKTVQLVSGSFVKITTFKGPQLYVRPADEKNENIFEKLILDLNDHCMSAVPLNRPPKKKELLACAFSADGLFYRAVVEDRVAAADGSGYKYSVRFVDFGNKETSTPENMRLLTDELAEIPLMAVRTHLKDVDVLTLSEEANQILHKFSSDDTPLTVVFEGPDGYLNVDLIDTDGSNINSKVRKLMGLDLAEETNLPVDPIPPVKPNPPAKQNTSAEPNPLIEQNPPAKANPPAPVTEDLQEDRFQISSMRFPEFPPKGSKFSALINYIDQLSGHVMCLPLAAADPDGIVLLAGKIKDYGDNSSGPYHPEMGEMVVAQWIDGEWYRAACLTPEESGAVSVYFVDHGNSDTISVQNLRQFRKEFGELTVGCSPCLIHGVETTPENMAKLDAELKEQSEKQGCMVAEATTHSFTDDVHVLDIPSLLNLI